jgi:DNA modification methylase
MNASNRTYSVVLATVLVLVQHWVVAFPQSSFVKGSFEMKIRDRIKELRRVPAGDLVPNPKNWRSHPAAQQNALKGLLEELGYCDALLARELANGKVEVIDGHLRRETTPDMVVPVLILDITEAEADKLLATLDPLASLAEADRDALTSLLAFVDTDSPAVRALLADLAAGDLTPFFDPGEIAGLTDPDAIPEPPDMATTKLGDVYVLGNHRLMCGDSANPEDVDRLLEGAKIHLLNMDPPYGVKVEPRSNNGIAAGLSSFAGNKNHQKPDMAQHPRESKPTTKKLRARDRPLVNDYLPEEDFDRRLREWFGNAARVLVPGRSFVIWGGYANLANYPPALRESGLYFSQSIVWDKEWPVLTRKDFMGAYELAFYGWKEGAAHQFFGPNNATDLWHIKKVNPQNMTHLTEKPVELATRGLQYCSRPGENVLDLFGGSGSTLIAAEQTGRRAFLMEIDPLYCDVIVARWERFTGHKAERKGTA